MKKQKERKPRRVSKVFSKTTQDFMEHLNWDFVPEFIKPGALRELLEKAKEKAEDISLESICGNMDDMQHVEQYDGTLGVTTAFVLAHERPVGQLQWNNNLAAVYTNPGNVNNQRWGSGTLIANDLFLTAGHCFDINSNGWTTPLDNTTGMSVPPAGMALNMHVNFNYQVDPLGNMRVEQSFPVTQLVEYRLGGIDFAIVRLGGNPGATYGVAGISNVDANDGDMLCIIQHPSGLPKRIEAGPQFHLHDDRVGYDTLDTLGGSSGSGILRATTGLIVGVHTNGGCTASGAGHNHGMRITSIIANSPTVTNLLQPVKFKFADDPTGTRKPLDDLHGHGTVKFIDDTRGGTFKAIDDMGGTFKVIDDRNTFKGVEDIKMPGRDKLFGDQLEPYGSWKVNPVNPAFGGPQPFILSTPHHSQEWQQNAVGKLTAVQMQQLTQEIQSVQDLMSQLHQQFTEAESYLQNLTETLKSSQ